MSIKKYLAVSMALTLFMLHGIPAYAHYSNAVENVVSMQMSSTNKVIGDCSDVVENIMNSITVEQSQKIAILDTYLESESVYCYTEQFASKPVVTTFEVPYEWIYGKSEENTEIIDDNQDYINEAQANYEAALAVYEQALADYEAASQIIESTREEEVEVTEEVEDEEGNLILETRTEVQTVTETGYAGDVEVAKVNLDVASATLDEARSQLDNALQCQEQATEESLQDEVSEEITNEQNGLDQIIEQTESTMESVSYTSSGSEGDNITWSLDDEGVLIISGNGEMANYSGANQMPWGTEVKKVIFENGITRIGDYTFYKCQSLTNITIPDSVTFIGKYAFYGCTNLSAVSIPENVESIWYSAFEGCTNLKTIKILSANIRISMGAFQDCSQIQSAGPIGEGYDYEFIWNNKIPDSAFDGCTGLKSIGIPSSITSIGNKAFRGCTSLEYIKIPSTIMDLGYDMLAGCSQLKTAGPIGSGCDYEFGWTTELPDCAFSGCESLIKISIPSSVTSIGVGAFENCKSITSIDLPNGINEIKRNTFYNCVSLKSILIPHNVNYIDEAAFCGCIKLSSVRLPDCLNQIGHSAFAGCSALNSISIPYGVESIDGSVFSSTGLLDVIIPESVTYIGPYAFSNCQKLTKIVLPTNITEINGDTFYNCISLTDIVIPDSVTYIGNEAFEKCEKLENIVLPNVTRIGSYAFRYCKSLRHFVIKSNNTTFGDYIFWGLTPNLLKTAGPIGSGCNYEFGWTEEIPAYAFKHCTELTSVVLPNSIKQIGDHTFCFCDNLRSIVIPKSVISIGESAFYYADNLSDIYYQGTISDWNKVTKKYHAVSHEDSDITIHYLGRDGGNIHVNNGYVLLQGIDQYLAQDSYVYNHEIAKYAAALSLLAYSDQNRIEEGLLNLGYNFISNNFDDTRNKSDYRGEYSPVSFGLRYIEGLDSTLVAVVIKGTEKMEWVTNFEAGSGLEHESFNNAATHVYQKLYEYLITKKDEIKGTLKILVTGHSRGAATANLVGAYLDDPSLNSNIINKIVVDDSNVFVYTFATPNTTRRSIRDIDMFKNIFNIVNPEDFVTKVIPSNWGYGRYGITFVLPTAQTLPTLDYLSYIASVRSYYSKYNSESSYRPYPLGMYEVSKYVHQVVQQVSSIDEYIQEFIGPAGTLNFFFEYALGGLLCENPTYMALAGSMIVSALAGFYGDIGTKTVIFFAMEELLGRIPASLASQYFAHAHEPESYLAMLNSIYGVEGYRNEEKYGIVNCPVDISVYNSAGTLVGQIINNEVQEGNEIWMYVDGDSKIYSLPEGDTYRIVLSGNDVGTMDYSIITEDTDTYAQNRTYHEGLELSTEKMYTTDDTSVYTILISDETEIDPTEEFNYETGKQLKVDITVEGRGSAPSLSNLTPGDYVTLNAFADSNNEFYGWYDTEGNLVSTDLNYSFSIHEDMAFTAKFSDVFVPTETMSFEEDSVTIYKREEYYNNLTIGPENATAQKIIWTSSNEKVATVDNGVVCGIKDGTATITASLEDGTVSACYTVTVRKDPVNKTSHTLSLEGNIGVNFYMEFSDVVLNDEEAIVEFTVDGNITTRRVKDATASGIYRRFSVDVSASQMSTDIAAKVILSDGRTIYTENYSVKQYCDNMLTKESTKQELKTLMEALLNYGAYSQTYFEYNADNLANSDLSNIDLSDVTADVLSKYKSVKAGNTEGLTFNGSTLILKSLTSIRHYFTVGEGHTIDEYTFIVDGNTLTPSVSGNMYYVEISNIASGDLDHIFLLTVGDFSIQYGALSYAYNQVKKSTAKETLQDACRALYKYNQAAKTYFKKTFDWNIDANGTLAISGSGEIKSTESWKTAVKQVVIEDGITDIGYGAFKDCVYLTSVVIPNSVKRINSCAFKNCTSLTNITIPATVTFNGDSAFKGCTKLKTAGPIGSNCNIEFGWTDAIPNFAFSNCSSLTNISIPDTVTRIGYNAFEHCTGITRIFCQESLPFQEYNGEINLGEIFIPNSVVEIGSNAFSACSELESAYLPSNITMVSAGLFQGCINLTNVQIPYMAAGIGSEAFSSCEKLSYIEIPSNVHYIEKMAFAKCSGLSTVRFFDNVEYIAFAAFDRCTNLKEIDLSYVCGWIGEYAFSGCKELKEVYLNNLTEINEGTFMDCSNLTFVEINYATRIGQSAFYNCEKLNSIKLGNYIKTIEKEAFTNCDELRIWYGGYEEDWNQIDIAGNAIPATVEIIYEGPRW